MNRLMVSLLGTLLVLLLAAPVARGQTGPTTVPTPTPVPTPSAEDLLARAYDGQAAHSSVHYDEVVTFATPKQSKEIDKTRGDISWRDGLMREYTTAHVTNLRKKPNTTHVSHSTVLIANHILSTRTNREQWDCSYIDISTSGSSPTAGDDSQDLSAIFTTAMLRQTNLGLETLNGVPVWHIRQTMVIPGITPANQPGTGDYYITQVDELPVREVVALTMNMVDPGSKSGRMTIIQNSTLNYSSYGETFGVKVPRACRTTRVTSSSAGSALLLRSPLVRAVEGGRSPFRTSES